jgi:hypothetical protein
MYNHEVDNEITFSMPIRDCRCKEVKTNIVLTWGMLGKVNYLMNKYRNCEWGGYLLGQINDANGNRIQLKNVGIQDIEVIVYDIALPPQEVSSASVNFNLNGWRKPKNVIGICHSHHTMGGFHSSVDTDYQSYIIAIVFSFGQNTRSIEANGKRRVNLPCDNTRYMLVDCNVEFRSKKVPDDNIKERKTVVNLPKYLLPSEITTVPKSQSLFPEIYDDSFETHKSPEKIHCNLYNVNVNPDKLEEICEGRVCGEQCNHRISEYNTDETGE